MSALKPFRPHAKTPCGECPFRRTAAPGWLGAAPPQMFVENIKQEQPSPCHMSIDYEDPSWEPQWDAGQIGKLCMGALILASNAGKLARNQRVLPRVPADREIVFSTLQEFVAYHEASPVKSWSNK